MRMGVMRRVPWGVILALWFVVPPLGAATLERLTLEEMAAKSTAIIRGRVISLRTAQKGPLVYTYATVQVQEQWKGVPALRLEVATPGGKLGTTEQHFAGAPDLSVGSEYLLFLWTGKNGLTQIIGLCQGIFDVKMDASGQLTVRRAAITETMVDPATRTPVTDDGMVMRLSDLRARVSRTLAAGGAR